METNERLSVTVIVRETQENKDKLWSLAKVEGFLELSDYLRAQWRKWL